MGKDKRGVERGKCTLCDCNEFEQGENIQCSYCGDPPAKHLQVHVDVVDVNSNILASESETKHDDVEFQEQSSCFSGTDRTAHKWEDTRLGWIPKPKRETGQFYNEVLKQFYRTYWPVCPDHQKFRKAFIAERTRQFTIKKKQINEVTQQLQYLRSQNPACEGRYLQEIHTPKKADLGNIQRLETIFKGKLSDLNSIIQTVKQQDNLLFCNGSGKMKSGRDTCHAFNEGIFEVVQKSTNEISEITRKLSNAKDLTRKIVTHHTRRNDLNRKRENKWKINNRARKVQKTRCFELFEAFGGEACEASISPSVSGGFQITDFDINIYNDVFPAGLNTRDRSCLKHMIKMGCFRGFALDFFSDKVL